jgi:regulatory protein
MSSRRDPTMIAIRVQGKAAATLHRRHLERLRLAVGTEWTDALAEQVQHAAAFDRAVKQAMAMLNRRALTAAQMTAKLKARGLDNSLAARVVEHLRCIGAIDDAAVGRSVIEQASREPTGEHLLRARLSSRGLDEALVEQLMGESQAAGDEVAAARRLVESRWRSMAKLDEATRLRRLWGLLARRGFEEDVIERVLGSHRSPSDDPREQADRDP